MAPANFGLVRGRGGRCLYRCVVVGSIHTASCARAHNSATVKKRYLFLSLSLIHNFAKIYLEGAINANQFNLQRAIK